MTYLISSNETLQRFAVSALVGECESIAESGLLPEPAEQSLRLLIAQMLSAFGMAAKAERQAARETSAIREARGHLGAALIQSIESDDQIIMEHVRLAHSLLGGRL
ncbi:MAG: hypothetical protein NVS3B5_01480 [Sphingomicrobium sp.]